MSHCEFRGLVFDVRDESFREASCRKGILGGGSYVLDWAHSSRKRGLTFESRSALEAFINYNPGSDLQIAHIAGYPCLPTSFPSSCSPCARTLVIMEAEEDGESEAGDEEED